MPPKGSLSNESLIRPKARVNDLVVQKIGSDLLVYDTLTEKASHLNETIAPIWKMCDGSNTIKHMAEAQSRTAGVTVERDFIILALKELYKAKLLTGEIPKSDFAQLSRRKVLLKYAAPTLAMPIVMSLVAPVSAQMGSCLGDGLTDCFNPTTPCCSPFTCVPVAVGFSGPGMCVPPVID